MDRIKDCPHCGGDGILSANYSPKLKLWFVTVKCQFCGATGKYYTQSESPKKTDWETDACYDAVSAWNKRYTPATEDDSIIYTDADSRLIM